jgi:hypothetical protein
MPDIDFDQGKISKKADSFQWTAYSFGRQIKKLWKMTKL